MTPAPREVAVIGSGVAGLTAAWIASRTARVTLFEADDRLGGHADTHVVPTPDGRALAIDTGFIVHNERTYPTLRRLFAELGVATQESEMSLSVSDPGSGVEWAGALGPRGLLPTWRMAVRPSHLRMLTEVPRFHRQARALLRSTERGGEPTVREFAAAHRFSDAFVQHFLEPLVAAVWSSEPGAALDYPARYLFTFLEHHGMLGVFGSPVWRTVVGGSRSYVDRVAAELDEVHMGTPVRDVRETTEGVEVTTAEGQRRFDAVVIATHPDQALRLLAEPTTIQRKVLGEIRYSPNRAILHTDSSLLPRAPGARASWNFRRREPGQPVCVTYDLTRLMRLPVDASGRRHLVTLGGEDLIDPDTVIATRDYEHPQYDAASVAAQQRVAECESDRLVLAGAWRGWGFHEDGARSGHEAATRLGLEWPAPRTIPLARPGIFKTTIRHTRRRPWRREFTHASHTWLVDLDALPDHGLWGRFEGRDHVGDPEASIRDNIDAVLASHGLPRPERILMLAQPRALGWCFNPISVFWCLDASGSQQCVVVEVHNTYGGRHAYVLEPDAEGAARVGKQLYVSPFHGTDGHYRVHVPLPTTSPDGTDDGPDRVDVGVELRPGASGDARFSASMQGRRIDDATSVDVRRAAVASWRGSALIHAHGIWLWARRLPVRPRPKPSREDH